MSVINASSVCMYKSVYVGGDLDKLIVVLCASFVMILECVCVCVHGVFFEVTSTRKRNEIFFLWLEFFFGINTSTDQ